MQVSLQIQYNPYQNSTDNIFLEKRKSHSLYLYELPFKAKQYLKRTKLEDMLSNFRIYHEATVSKQCGNGIRINLITSWIDLRIHTSMVN